MTTELTNRIYIVTMFVTVVSFVLFTKFQSEANEKKATEIIANQALIEGRVRGLEVRDATVAERVENVQSDIDEIKVDVSQINDDVSEINGDVSEIKGLVLQIIRQRVKD